MIVMIICVMVFLFVVLLLGFGPIYVGTYISAKIVKMGIHVNNGSRYFDVQYCSQNDFSIKCKRILVDRDVYNKYKVDDEILICVF